MPGNNRHASKFDDLVLKIHAAPLQPDGWQGIAAGLRDLLQAERTLMLRVGSEPGEKPWMLPIEFDPEALRHYIGYWAPHDYWLHGAVEQRRTCAGLVSLGQQLADPRACRQLPFHNEFLRTYRVEQMMNVCLEAPTPPKRGPATALSVYRSAGKPAFSAADARLLQRLTPHLMLALRHFWQARALALENATLHSALDHIATAVFAVRPDGSLEICNRAGETALRSEQWIQLRNGRLSAAPAVPEGRELERVLGALREGRSASLILTDARQHQQAFLEASPVGSVDSVPRARAGVAGWVWLVPLAKNTSAVDTVARIYALTAAEHRLLRQLFEGGELSESAARLSVSIHTARTQLKAIFSKTGRRTQSQLLALLHMISVTSKAETVGRD